MDKSFDSKNNNYNEREEIYKKIATQLLKEVLDEDLSAIQNRDKILDIYKQISTSTQKDKNYYLVHSKIQKNDKDSSIVNENFMDILIKNNEKLYNEIYKKIKSEFVFEIELHKYGRVFNSIRQRWAYILYPNTFGSTKEPPLKAKQGKSGSASASTLKFKDKNYCLETMQKIEIEKYSNNLKDYKSDPKKNPLRIRINYKDINKKNRDTDIFLYFQNEETAKQTYDLLMLMRINFLKKNNQNTNTKNMMENLKDISSNIEGSHKFAIMKKIIGERLLKI